MNSPVFDHLGDKESCVLALGHLDDLREKLVVDHVTDVVSEISE